MLSQVRKKISRFPYTADPAAGGENFERIFDLLDEKAIESTVLEAGHRVSYIVSQGFIEEVCELRNIGESVRCIVEKFEYIRCAWFENHSWHEVSAQCVDDIVAQIKILQLPSDHTINTAAVLLSPTFVGTVFHEFAHALEVDHAPQALHVIGKDVFGYGFGKEISVFEDPTCKSFGQHKYSDTGCLQKRRMLVDHGVLKAVLGNYETGENLYVGISNESKLSPRTVCLKVEGPCSSIPLNEGILVLGGEVTSLLMRPCEMILWIDTVEICAFRESRLLSHNRIPIKRAFRFCDMLNHIEFVDCNIILPSVGGFCQKGSSLIRSTQYSRFAYWK